MLDRRPARLIGANGLVGRLGGRRTGSTYSIGCGWNPGVPESTIDYAGPREPSPEVTKGRLGHQPDRAIAVRLHAPGTAPHRIPERPRDYRRADRVDGPDDRGEAP